ncbi:MAG: exodeoxyribonuclease VII small subunit [Blastocatellia bacterium]|nr:exodeoxyribonuclease VII small subunit [Blastocatellia bacterium]MCS7157850.1 exodeoxyribonuclease VII small subunit [Blastocatellia bacterium]MCX7753413.1 exodeoxyribonuclease VII small subunit [Blastocatellia bacterium]MDW8168072.1 exodeoxyribonuclease VII small subunit [Acidobacteriota bacterium]MDW8257679.1 exodeoxyribonuclease VII small subunit [Acidobacteriota bacterium]
MNKASKPTDFEAALKELEGIVEQLENGDLPLERALELFERGVRLSRECQKRLEEAERKVEILIKNARGEYEAQPFEEPPEEEAPRL